MKRLTTPQMHSHGFITSSDMSARIEQRCSNLRRRSLAGNTRQIRTEHRPSARDHMTAATFPCTEKILLTGRAISRCRTLSRRHIHRLDPGGKCIKLTRGKIERRHPTRRNAVFDHTMQPRCRFPPQIVVSRQRRTVFAAFRFGSMTQGTLNRIDFLCLLV